MARTIEEIQAEIIANIQSDSTLSGASSTSATAIWRLLARIVATAIALLENLFDFFKADVNAAISEMKPHTAAWYQNKAKAFQLGYDLAEGVDYYDNTGVDETLVDNSKIIAAAAVTEENGTLVVKVNKDDGGDLVVLSAAEYDAFEAYMNEIKDAGVFLSVRSFSADKAEIEVDIYYDSLIIDSAGQRLDGTGDSGVKAAIESFLKSLPFNGEFVKSHLTDALQGVDGVFVPQIRSCQIARFDSSNFTSVDVKYKPYSGFIRLYNEADLTINYIANV